MNIEELITKQQLQIEELKEEILAYRDSLYSIDSALYRIGGPLNDNKLKFSNQQRNYLRDNISVELSVLVEYGTENDY